MVTDKTRREAFITQNLGLVHACAGRFRGRGMEYDDLYSAGCVGLIKAYDNFDESRGVCFSTYAVPVILGEIKKLFRDGGTVKVSRSLKELGMRVQAAREHTMKLCGTEPTLQQLAEQLDEPIENVALAIQAAKPAMSLTPEGGEDGDRQLDIPVESPEEELADRISLAEVIEALLWQPHPERDCKSTAHDSGTDLPAGTQDPDPAAHPAFGGIREEVSIKNVKNWAKSQKNDFGVKIVKKRLLFEGCCAKIHYCQADVRQNEILQKRRQTERFDRIKNEPQKSFKKVLDNLSRK